VTADEAIRSRGIRVARGLSVAVLSVVVAAFSHVAGGGMTPGALGTTLALTLAALVSVALAGRTLSTPRLVVSVLLSQVVFHVLFGLGATASVASRGTASVGMLGMVMSGGARTVLPAVATAPGAHTMAMDDSRMWLGHAAAALVTVLILRHGERSFWSLVRLASARLVRLTVVVLALPAALRPGRRLLRLALADRRGLRAPTDVLLASRPRRGPPRVA
jgi:hypothetical protein